VVFRAFGDAICACTVACRKLRSLLAAMLNDHLLGASDSASRKPRTPLLLTLALVAAVVLAAVFIGLYVREAHKSAPIVDPSSQMTELQAELQSALAVSAEAQRNASVAEGMLRTAQVALADSNHELVVATEQLADSEEHVADLQKNGVPPPSPTTLSAETREWILSAMNFTADPCEDFTQYTCGAWQAANPVVTPMFGSPEAIQRSFRNVTSRLTQAEQDVLANKFEEAAQVRPGGTHGRSSTLPISQATNHVACCKQHFHCMCSLVRCHGLLSFCSTTMAACRDRSRKSAIPAGRLLSPRLPAGWRLSMSTLTSRRLPCPPSGT
jgi:hypothetical protein